MFALVPVIVLAFEVLEVFNHCCSSGWLWARVFMHATSIQRHGRFFLLVLSHRPLFCGRWAQLRFPMMCTVPTYVHVGWGGSGVEGVGAGERGVITFFCSCIRCQCYMLEDACRASSVFEGKGVMTFFCSCVRCACYLLDDFMACGGSTKLAA